MLTDILFPWLTCMALEEIQIIDRTILFSFTSVQAHGLCPCCQQISESQHSWYQRRLADLPCAGSTIVLDVSVRKFFCTVNNCPRQIFCERINELASAYARRTQRLYQEQQRLGLEVGGEVGAQTAQRQGMPVSASTILRQVRQASLPDPPTPRKIGVDDFALRKGESYGTILVDLERHQPIDLLPDRTAATLAKWLQEHPGVEIITRDRANDYIEGATQGAPKATQVRVPTGRRFHLLQNVREMLQRLLERHQAALRTVTAPKQVPSLPIESAQVTNPTSAEPLPLPILSSPPSSIEPTLVVKQTKAAEQRDVHRSQRVARYEQVRTLHAQGHSQRAIARQLRLSIHTVRQFVKADQFPERATRRRVSSKLDPYLPYLRAQLAAGRDNATQLWRELCDQHGYIGSRPLVARWVAHHRPLCPPPTPDLSNTKRRGAPPRPSSEHVSQRSSTLSARQAAWLLLRPPHELDEEQELARQRLCDHSPQLQTTYSLVQEFVDMLQQHSADSFADWLTRAESTNIPELHSFAVNLRSDYAAVTAALSLPESNAQCEGQVNRLKFIKRSMYGRANFDLLRLRVLAT